MTIAIDDCMDAHPLEGVGESDPSGDDAQSAEVHRLSVIRVSDGDGRFLLTAALLEKPPDVTVDIAPGALRVRSGRTSRWVPLPDDALLDQAVVRQSEDTLTVTIPERERRSRRDIIHVW